LQLFRHSQRAGSGNRFWCFFHSCLSLLQLLCHRQNGALRNLWCNGCRPTSLDWSTSWGSSCWRSGSWAISPGRRGTPRRRSSWSAWCLRRCSGCIRITDWLRHRLTVGRTGWRCPWLSWRTSWWSSGLSWRTGWWSPRLRLWLSNRGCLSSCDWWSTRYRCLSSDWCWWASWSSDAWRTHRWWGSGCISRTGWRCPRLSLWLSNRGCLSSGNWWSTRCRSLSSNWCWWGS
jgi:hypothetical protein